MLLAGSFYGITYYYYVSNLLDKQTTVITGWPMKPTAPVRVWMKLQNLTRRLIAIKRPRISLTVGSLLILISLFLSTSAACDSGLQRLPGYKLLLEPGDKMQELEWHVSELKRLMKEPLGSEVEVREWQDPGGGWWISTVMQLKVRKGGGLYWRNSIHNLGRFTYVLSLVVAIFTLLVIISSIGRYKLYGVKKINAALFLLSVTLSLIVITDFSFNAFWFKDELFLLSNLFWIVPTVFLCFVTLSSHSYIKTHGDLIKSSLVILLLPLVISATAYVCYVTLNGFTGVLVYFVGINLISLTYLKVINGNLRDGQVALEASLEEPAVRDSVAITASRL